MAICDLCEQEMTTGSSCSVETLHREGAPHPLFTYGNDPGWRTRRGRCHDCGVAVGGFHHLGCDIQACPGCGGQLISCGCRWDEFAGEYGPDDDFDDLDDIA